MGAFNSVNVISQQASQLNSQKIAANADADRLEAGMSLALTMEDNKQKIKVLLILFAAFALWMNYSNNK